MIHTTVISEAFVYSQKQVKNKQRTSFACSRLFLTIIDYSLTVYVSCRLSQKPLRLLIFSPQCEGSDSSSNIYNVGLLPAALTWQKLYIYSITQCFSKSGLYQAKLILWPLIY